MFNHLHQKIILDYLCGKSLDKYDPIEVAKALSNYYGSKAHKN